jgi:hypothetical protein
MRSGNPTAADLIEQPSRWSLPRHEFFVARASYFECKGFPLERPQRLLNDNLMVSTERKPTSAFKHPGFHSSQNINSAALRRRLAALGHIEGKNLVIEARWLDGGRYDRLASSPPSCRSESRRYRHIRDRREFWRPGAPQRVSSRHAQVITKRRTHRSQNAGVALNRRHLLRSVFATAIWSRACQPATVPMAR